jgi:hypothetical protein
VALEQMGWTVHADTPHGFGLTARRLKGMERCAAVVTPEPNGVGCVLRFRMVVHGPLAPERARGEVHEFLDHVAGKRVKREATHADDSDASAGERPPAPPARLAWLTHPGEARQKRKEERAWWNARWTAHQAVIEQAVQQADYTSFESFYTADERRRGDDVTLGEVVDGELLWAICWLPATAEVAAFSVAWRDERWHRVLVASGSAETGTGHADLGATAIPELVMVLGTALPRSSADIKISSETTLRALRDSLA